MLMLIRTQNQLQEKKKILRILNNDDWVRLHHLSRTRWRRDQLQLTLVREIIIVIIVVRWELDDLFVVVARKTTFDVMIASFAVFATSLEMLWDATTLRERTQIETCSSTNVASDICQHFATLNENFIDVRVSMILNLSNRDDVSYENDRLFEQCQNCCFLWEVNIEQQLLLIDRQNRVTLDWDDENLIDVQNKSSIALSINASDSYEILCVC